MPDFLIITVGKVMGKEKFHSPDQPNQPFRRAEFEFSLLNPEILLSSPEHLDPACDGVLTTPTFQESLGFLIGLETS